MTQRLYYEDSYSIEFAASVVERLEWERQPAAVLDRSAFYPTGGGQPHDVGWLDGVRVIDVLVRPDDDAVVHVLERPLDNDQVTGRIDWERRFDLMQQHTGQHVLSAAFVEQVSANTVGFHLSDDYATIDVDHAPLTDSELIRVEVCANQAVYDNRPVEARFVAEQDVALLHLRKELVHDGPVRIVDIPGFDCSACGGTHVARTGELGTIKIVRSERRGAETRVEFLCGKRAEQDYRAKNSLVMDLAREYTIGRWELADLVHRMEDELKNTRRALRQTRDALLDAVARTLGHDASEMGDWRVVRAHLADRSADDLKHLAQRFVSQPGWIVLLAAGGTAEDRCFFTFARSEDVPLHMGTLIRAACEAVGGRGGGRPEFAQGSGPENADAATALFVAYNMMGATLGDDLSQA